MKKIKTTLSALALSLSLISVNSWAIPADYLSQDNISQYDKAFNFVLAKVLPAPKGKEDGRGAPIEHLVIQYAPDYVDDPYLKEDVLNFRRWYWQAMYASLDQKVKEKPTYLNTYRLQAEAYFVNKEYREALSQLDQILRQNPRDVHALAMTVLASRVLEDTEQETARLSALKQLAPEVAQRMTDFFAFTEQTLAASYGNEPQTAMIPDTIAVFGSTPNKDGTPSPLLLDRLQKTKEMAQKFPQAKIIVSGGAVKTEFAEADVMAKWLSENGIEKDRLLLDPVARDTPGNAVGIIKLMQTYNGKKVLGIGTLQHIPRATAVLKGYAQHIGYPIEIDSVGGGKPATPGKAKIEALYTYVNVARSMGLFELGDFK
ncbi:YdcF family protein [Mannheimia haemolytica]|uniref:YdcF family protein n=1 Tax=Mannheimia haemolytica TaxID=75985 RepID=UPI002EC304BF|nr:ElyC/SanA/YdcF family protein [Mannheimia haemolytica]